MSKISLGFLSGKLGGKKSSKAEPAPNLAAPLPVLFAPHDERDAIEAKTVALICCAVAAARGKSLSQLKFLSIERAGSARAINPNAVQPKRFKGTRRVVGARSAWATSAAAQIIADRQKFY
ncbi:MAG: hypothetical protein FWE85_04535 [Clostridiales bacterium]|nr:hypothetical protein [Clostridiales bacterium]